MKKILFLVSILFIASCSEEKIPDATNKKADNLTMQRINIAILRDQVFLDYLTSSYHHFQRVQNLELVNQYVQDSYLSPEEMSDIHHHFGYNSIEELNEYAIMQNERVLYLHENYQIKDYSSSELFEVVDQGYIDLNLPDHGNNSTDNICIRKWKNCRRQAHAVSITMHMGCATIDVTTLPGLICHGAALAYQYYALEECNIEYEDCTN